MALRDALFCCLLAIWLCQRSLGLPLSPAPAVGEWSATLSLSPELPESRGRSARAKSEVRGPAERGGPTPANWAPGAPGAHPRCWARVPEAPERQWGYSDQAPELEPVSRAMVHTL